MEHSKSLYLIFTAIFALNIACKGGNFFGAPDTEQRSASPKIAIQTSAASSKALEDFLSSEDNISNALDEISSKTLADLMKELLELFDSMNIDDRAYAVQLREVGNLPSNAQKLLVMIEDSNALSALTIEEIIQKEGGSLDSALNYGYDGFKDDLDDNFETYSDSEDSEVIVDNTIKSAVGAANGEGGTATKTFGKDDDNSSPVGDGTESPVCAANQKSRSRLNASAIAGFAIAVATTNFCKDLSAKTGRKAANDPRCFEGVLLAGMSAVTTASAIVGKFAIDSNFACGNGQ